MRLEIPAAVWDKLMPTKRAKVCAVPKRVALGQPARLGSKCVFDHPAITEADCKAVMALIRPKRKVTSKEQ